MQKKNKTVLTSLHFDDSVFYSQYKMTKYAVVAYGGFKPFVSCVFVFRFHLSVSFHSFDSFDFSFPST